MLVGSVSTQSEVLRQLYYGQVLIVLSESGVHTIWCFSGTGRQLEYKSGTA